MRRLLCQYESGSCFPFACYSSFLNYSRTWPLFVSFRAVSSVADDCSQEVPEEACRRSVFRNWVAKRVRVNYCMEETVITTVCASPSFLRAAIPAYYANTCRVSSSSTYSLPCTEVLLLRIASLSACMFDVPFLGRYGLVPKTVKDTHCVWLPSSRIEDALRFRLEQTRWSNAIQRCKPKAHDFVSP